MERESCRAPSRRRSRSGSGTSMIEPGEVIGPRPVDERDVALEEAGGKDRAIDDAAERPEVHVAVALVDVWQEEALLGLQRAGMGCRPGKQRAVPRGIYRGNVAAPEVIVAGPLDHVVFAFDVIDRKAPADGLHILRLVIPRHAGLPGHLLRFETSDIFRAG